MEEHELKDISPLLREITSHFFENEFQQCRDAAPLLNEVNNIISRTSLPSACNSVSIECNRPRISEDELHKSILKEPPRETNSNASLKQETKPRISASGFLTTSFFSLPQAPEYSTYPVQINLRYAEEPLPNLTNTKSTQYCEQDFLNVSKSVRTSTRGLQSFSDNSTQSENLDNGNDCLEHSITQKVAHFFEITPIRKSRLKSTKHIFQGKIDRGTNTSDGMANAVEPMLLYVNSTGHFASTDDTTIESKFDSEDDNIRKIFKHAKSPKNQPQISTRNCCTSTSGTCICSEMCLKIKEWYKHLQKTPNPTFHARQITPSSHTMKTPSWNKQDCTLKYCPSGELSYETASNKKIDCEDAIKKLSEYLVADVKSVSSNIHNPSLEKLQDYVHERNLIDILNQRYPTFIGFQFNNNETKKIKYTINRKTPSVRRKKVPKIIIREKRKSCNNTRSRSDSENDRNARQQVKSKTSVISIATNSANMLEIRDIIESMLPKSSSRLKIVNSERYIRQQQCVRTSNQSTNTSSSHDDLLRLEVEKIVDELLHEIPSTSQMIYDRSLQNSLIPKPKQSWHTKDSFTSFTNELELHPIEDSLFRSVYTEKFPSQTVIPLFHRFKLGDIKKKIRTEEKVRFELAEPESEEHGQLSEEVKDETIPPENHPEEIQSADVDSQNPTGTEEVLRQYNLNKGFYAQIIQKTGSLEHPLVCSKISHSSTKSSVHSFIRSLLLCLKYGDSNTTLTNASIQCDDLDKSYSGNLKKKKRKHSLMPSLSTYSTQSSLQSEDEGWGEKKLSILEESEKIDKANMAFTPMNSVGIQALVVTRDKEVSPTLIPPKNKKSVKKNTHTQTKSTMEITYRDNSMQYDAPPQKQKDVVMYPSFDNKKVSTYPFYIFGILYVQGVT